MMVTMVLLETQLGSGESCGSEGGASFSSSYNHWFVTIIFSTVPQCCHNLQGSTLTVIHDIPPLIRAGTTQWLILKYYVNPWLHQNRSLTCILLISTAPPSHGITNLNQYQNHHQCCQNHQHCQNSHVLHLALDHHNYECVQWSSLESESRGNSGGTSSLSTSMSPTE